MLSEIKLKLQGVIYIASWCKCITPSCWESRLIFAYVCEKEWDVNMYLRGKSVPSRCDGSSDRSSMVDPLSYFSFQPVLHDWYNKGCGMRYPVCWMVHIKEPLLFVRKSIPCGGSGFPLLISNWSFPICPTP